MLRRILFASAIAACAALPSIASAAPAANWSGFYVGVNGGYGGDKFKYNADGAFTDNSGEVPTVTDFSGEASQTSGGFIGGAQIGYNFQAGEGWVIGAEADIDASNIKGETSISGSSLGDLTGSASAAIRSKLDYLGTVRARVGMPIGDGRFMPYVTGGLAYGRVKSAATLGIDGGSSLDSFTESVSKTRTGWTLGAGAEYAITDNVSFKTEYLYVDLGRHTLLDDSFDIGGDVLGARLGLKTTANIVRAGVNIRFGM